MALDACGLARGPGFVEAWRLQLLAVDHDPRTMLSPSVTHDLELQANRRQLRRRRMTYFYCEFFHFAASFMFSMSFLTSRRISSIASAILFSCFVSMLYLFLMYPIISGTGCQACSLELEACSFFQSQQFFSRYFISSCFSSSVQ